MSLAHTAIKQNIFWPKDSLFVKPFLFVLIGVLTLFIAAQLRIPLFPVPITLESTTVILIGMTYGSRYGTAVVAFYLLAGLCGLPVFEGFTFGLNKLTSPTGGYLIGFLPAAFLSGYLAEHGWAKNIFSSFVAACLGNSVIFLFGVTVLAQLIGWDKAIAFGLLPFIVSEPVKLIAVSFIAPRIWK